MSLWLNPLLGFLSVVSKSTSSTAQHFPSRMPYWFIITCFVCLFLIIQKLYHPFITENPKYLTIQRLHYFYFTLSDCCLPWGFSFSSSTLEFWFAGSSYESFYSSPPPLPNLHSSCLLWLLLPRPHSGLWSCGESGATGSTQICFTKKEALAQVGTWLQYKLPS